MEIMLQSFAVELQAVRNTFGSEDQTLLESVRKTAHYAFYAGREEAGLLDRCLNDLLFNYHKPEERKTNALFGLIKTPGRSGLDESLAHLYGYALMGICEVLGTYLNENDGDIFHAGRIWDETNHFLEGQGFKVTLKRMERPNRHLFDIPAIQDLPIINSFSVAEVTYLLEALNRLNLHALEQQEQISESQADLLGTFRRKLQVCANKGVEWLGFML